jgi:hypothetical protein
VGASQSGCFGEGKNLLPLLEFEPWTIQPIAYSLYRLLQKRINITTYALTVLNPNAVTYD